MDDGIRMYTFDNKKCTVSLLYNETVHYKLIILIYL